MARGLKFGLPIAALILALAVVVEGQVWTSSGTGVSTKGTMEVTGTSVHGGSSTFNGGIVQSAALPALQWTDTDSAANEKTWLIFTAGNALTLRTTEDTPASFPNVIDFTRSGVTPTGMVLHVPVTGFGTSARIESMTGQPGFLAFKTANDGPFVSPFTMVFNSEVYDDTAAYSPVSGVFTAAVTGRYFFTAVASYTSGGATDTTLSLVTSNRTYQLARHDFTAAITHSMAGSVIADMDAGDTASIQGGAINQLDGHASTLITYFSGRLVP